MLFWDVSTSDGRSSSLIFHAVMPLAATQATQPDPGFIAALLVIAFLLYWLPTGIAVLRGSHLLGPVIIANLFGFTGAWVVALVLAVWPKPIVSDPEPGGVDARWRPDVQYSPDGRFWWNAGGRRWEPVSRHAQLDQAYGAPIPASPPPPQPRYVGGRLTSPDGLFLVGRARVAA